MTYMVLTTGECGGYYAGATRRYEERYLNHQIPNRKTLTALELRLKNSGSFIPSKKTDQGRIFQDLHINS